MELKPDGKSVKNSQSKNQSLPTENLSMFSSTPETSETSDFSEKNALKEKQPAEKQLAKIIQLYDIEENVDINQGSTQSVSVGLSMPTSHVTSTSTQTPSNVHRPGECLRQARLQKKRELKEIAIDLHISERILTAIEADDYKSLPEPAFIRGYLRAYGRLLGIDSDTLIVQFDELYTSATGLSSNHSLENSPLQQLAKLSNRTRKSRRWMLWLLILVVVVLLMMTLMPAIQSALNAANETATSTVSLPVESDNTLYSTPSATANPSTLNALPPVAAQTQSDQLVFTLSKPSDVNVEDSTGKMLFAGIAETGQPLTLNGVSPFNIRLADALSVSLTLNGEKVDVRPFAVNGVASFRLSR